MQKLPSKSWHPFAVFLGTQLVAMLLGWVLSLGRDTKVWYQALNKPGITPPDWVFGPVWFVLYILIGIAGVFLWKHREGLLAKSAITLWFAQMIVNVLWTYFFFYKHFIGLALVDLLLLDLLVFVLLALSWRISGVAFSCLCPYFLWILFASILNIMIFMAN